MVLPVDIGNAFIERATAMGWHLRLRTDVAETDAAPPHRVLLASPTAGGVFQRQAGDSRARAAVF